MKPAKFAYSFIPILLPLILFNCSRSTVDLEQYVLNGATMGTSYNIKIVEPATTPFNQSVFHQEIDKLLRDINQMMSTYIEDSEISNFNQAPANKWVQVSPEMVDVFQSAIEISQKSMGAFDITVGPLVNLWGFGPEHNSSELPTDADIQSRMALTGWQYLMVRDDPPALQKGIPKLYCDLSAIAKGWGVDQVADYIESQNFHNYLVEIGGEIRAKGLNLQRGPWRIGVSSPEQFTGIQKIIEVRDVGIATSGDYRNYFEKDGVRYSHTIDPRTGRPINHNVASVTVIHESCKMADAYATALNVLGLQQGMALAEKENLAVFFIAKSENGFVEKMTESFSEYIQ
jgi:thiamine biosynthesis lipoprotein